MTQLSDCLSLRKIAKVVCIDDENATPKFGSTDDVADALASAKTSQLTRFAKQDKRFTSIAATRRELNESERDERLSILKAKLDELIDEHKLESKDFEELRSSLYRDHIGETSKTLQTLFPGLTLPLSFGEWKKQCDSIIAAASAEARLLLLVDEVNDDEPDIDLDGIKLIASLWRSHAAAIPFVDIVLLTSRCPPDKEFQEAKSVLDAVRAELGDDAVTTQVVRAFVVSKERLGAPPYEKHFVAQLNRLQASQLRGELVSLTLETLKAAVTESMSWLEKIPLSEFQGSVFASSEREGAEEIDTLLRLAGIKQRVRLEQELRGNTPLTQKIGQLRAFSLKTLDAEYREASQSELSALREMEFERRGDHINSLYAPIVCGDVFDFNFGGATKQVMLLANPCDLTLRADGKRKLARGWLVEVQRRSKGELDKDEGARESRAPLSYLLATGKESNDTAYLFNNSNVESVALHVLDMCTTNHNGSADFSPEAALGAYGFVTGPQRRCIEKIAKRIADKKYGLLELWGRELTPVITEVPPKVIGVLSCETRVSYPVRRVWRMAAEFSAASLVALSQSIARPAFDHDFLRAS